MTCDVKKITYNMYSCDTCFMSREMMEMDGRDSVKCQKSKRKDMISIIEIDLVQIVMSPTTKKGKKENVREGEMQ